MDRIEKLINDHISELDDEFLSLDHELRFRKKLDAKFHTSNRFLIRYAVTIAASVLIFAMAAVFVYLKIHSGYQGTLETSQTVELHEAEQYYADQTEKAFQKLETTLHAQTEDVSSPIYASLNEMETGYKQLKADLENNPDDIRLMSAIVQYHQMRLELLNNLIEKFTLYSSSNSKTKGHENI